MVDNINVSPMQERNGVRKRGRGEGREEQREEEGGKRREKRVEKGRAKNGSGREVR